MMQPLRTIVVDMMICHLECLHLLLESFYRNLAKYGNMSQEKPSRFLATRIFTNMQYASVKALGRFSLVKFTVQKRVLRPGLRRITNPLKKKYSNMRKISMPDI